MTNHPLDREIWNCLTGHWAPIARGGDLAKAIDTAYGPFGAAADQSEGALAALAELAPDTGELWMVEAEPWPVPPGLNLIKRAELVQLVAENALASSDEGSDLILLNESHAAEMARLAGECRPGPWSTKTHLYGDYYGLFDNGRLIAMAGERMRTHGYCEVSGVCTDPDYRGRGLASRLIQRVMNGITARGETPFLHSYPDNMAAIGLYNSLGFQIRKTLFITILQRSQDLR